MNEQVNENFNWDLYENGYNGATRLVPNRTINGADTKNICYSHETYAQQLFDTYTNQDSNLIKKDLKKGDIVIIKDIFNIKENYIDVELAGGLTVTVDLLREKKFISIYGYNTVNSFITDLRNKDYLRELINKKLNAYILEANPSVRISLWQGHLKSIRDEFVEQIKNPTKAYTAKIIEANKGGFFVEVQGIEAFMPGSLAAPNKILNFSSYVGKEVIVMIEDFLKEMNSFIVSHKKYLAHIIPIKITELNLNKKYSGLITGCSKYGIFVEFEELFTGLLHITKMDNETKNKFEQQLIKPNDCIEFYISEITKDNRIILTKESPEEKLNKIQNFILNSKDKILDSTVAAVMNFGMIINIDEMSGLIPIKQFKQHKIMANNFMIGEKIKVMFDTVVEDKLIFKLPISSPN